MGSPPAQIPLIDVSTPESYKPSGRLGTYQSDIHGCLRIVVTIESTRSSIRQSTDHLAVNPPLELIRGPVNGVVVPVILRIVDWVVDCAVV